MSIWAPGNFIMVNTFNVPKYGDMIVLPSQIYLSSSRSTPECCKFVHHVGELEHESIVQKGWLSPWSHPVKFLQNKQFQGPIACIAPPLVRMPSHTTYQANLCLDPISSTVSIQTLESTIQIYHHMKWHSCFGNHTTAPKTKNSQCKVGNLLDFPTQHKVPYVLDANQHWISQWCCCK